MNFLKVSFFVIIFLFSNFSFSLADFRATPTFSLREEYNDNIYLDYKNEKSDFITLIRPTINIVWETQIINLTFNFGIEYEKYLNNSAEDDLRPSQGARLDSTWNFYQDVLFLRVSDIYERVPVDESDKSAVDNNLVNLTDSNRLVINPYFMLLPLQTLQARFDCQYEDLWYREKEGDDAEKYLYSLTFTKEITSRASIDLYGGFTQYRPKDISTQAFEQNSNQEYDTQEYDRRDTHLGLLWKISETLSLRGVVGRTWVDYIYRDDYDSTLVSGQADYQISSALSLGAGYNEDISDSVDEGTRKQKKYSAYLRYSDRSKIILSLYKTEDDYLEFVRKDDSWGGTLNCEFPLTNKKGIAWLTNYTNYEKGDQENYHRYGARVEFYYESRIGRASLGYTWNKTDSDISDNNYKNNIVFAQIVLHW